jgi:hypothetical protein
VLTDEALGEAVFVVDRLFDDLDLIVDVCEQEVARRESVESSGVVA